MNDKEINFIEAKMLAESSAKKLITVWGDLENPSPPYLSNYYMEDKLLFPQKKDRQLALLL